MNNKNLFVIVFVIFLCMFFNCIDSTNPISGSSDYFNITAAAPDSTGHCYSVVFPKPEITTGWCEETLHASDTIGAFYVTNDTEDALFPLPAGLYVYCPLFVVDSTDCNSVKCKYWVKNIQINSVIKWAGIGYVCSFQGKPVAIDNSPRTRTVYIGYPTDTVQITYRDSINTFAGSTRNEIITIQRSIAMQKISVTSSGLPNEIKITGYAEILPTFGFNYKLGQSVFKINVLADIQKGKYNFNFNINVDGKDYKNIPCILNVY